MIPDDFLWQDLVEKKIKPLLEHKRQAEALGVLELFCQQNPKHIPGLMTLANLLAMGTTPSQYGQALNYYQQVCLLDPHYPEPYQSSAKIWIRLKEPFQAALALKMAIYLEPKDPKNWQLFESLKDHFITSFQNGFPDIVLYTAHPFMPQSFVYPSQAGSAPMAGGDSMFLMMAKGLAQKGLKVALFANFKEPKIDEGIECLLHADFFVLNRTMEFPVCLVSRYFQPFLKGLRAKKKIAWLHDMALPSLKDQYLQADAFIDEYWPLSYYHQQSFLDLGLPQHKFWITTNAFDPHLFGPYVPLEKRRRGQLVYASRPSRGLEILFEVYRELKQAENNLNLKVCTYSEYPDYREDPEIKPFLNFFGKQDCELCLLDKQALALEMQRSHLMLYPNMGIAETSCMAVIEAMAAGLVVLTSDRGALPETLSHGKTGWIVPYGPLGLKERLISQATLLLQDDSLWSQLSQGAYQQAMQLHHRDRLLETWCQRLQIIC